MELSRRLQAVANLVSEGLIAADIGTDHGYIPVYLLNTGKCPKVIAMDVNRGPLKKAEEHIGELLERGEAVLRLSDGLKALAPGEAECAILAGMGGNLVIRILKESKDVAAELKELVLQPQSEIEKVRAFLLQEGFSVIQEELVSEAGKYYPMMKAVPAENVFVEGKKAPQGWSEAELRYGKLLLEMRHPVLYRYLLREENLRREILKEISKTTGNRAEKRALEIRHELSVIAQALKYYEDSDGSCVKERRGKENIDAVW